MHMSCIAALTFTAEGLEQFQQSFMNGPIYHHEMIATPIVALEKELQRSCHKERGKSDVKTAFLRLQSDHLHLALVRRACESVRDKGHGFCSNAKPREATSIAATEN
jgi:hypothetical protein